VLEGGLYYPQDILPHYRRNSNAQAVRVGPAVEQLSRREQEVFRMMRDGAGSAVISARLQISRSTVNAHLTNIKKKLGASSFRELYRLAYCFSDRNDTERIGA
jgi:DNA-binding CsgD family transcriptional regulator